MLRCFCDVCGKELGSGHDARYAVRMESRRVNSPTALTDADLDGQDDPDHLDAMEELLGDPDAADATPPPPPQANEFDLCGGCYRKFSTDPLGFQRRRAMSYSAN